MQTRVPRNVFYSVLLVLVWLGFLAEGSHALLVTNAGLTGNTLTTGNVGLLISTSQDPNPTVFATSRPGFTINSLPGQADSHYLTLQNNSPSSAALDINASYTAQDSPADLASATSVTFVAVNAAGTVTGTPVTEPLSSMNSPEVLNITIPAGGSQRIRMDTTVNPNYGRANQSATYDLTFVGVQHYVP